MTMICQLHYTFYCDICYHGDRVELSANFCLFFKICWVVAGIFEILVSELLVFSTDTRWQSDRVEVYVLSGWLSGNICACHLRGRGFEFHSVGPVPRDREGDSLWQSRFLRGLWFPPTLHYKSPNIVEPIMSKLTLGSRLHICLGIRTMCINVTFDKVQFFWAVYRRRITLDILAFWADVGKTDGIVGEEIVTILTPRDGRILIAWMGNCRRKDKCGLVSEPGKGMGMLRPSKWPPPV
jgi:hypothetical protein